MRAPDKYTLSFTAKYTRSKVHESSAPAVRRQPERLERDVIRAIKKPEIVVRQGSFVDLLCVSCAKECLNYNDSYQRHTLCFVESNEKSYVYTIFLP